MKKQIKIIPTAQRFAMAVAFDELLASLGQEGALVKYDLLELNPTMPATWRNGLRSIAPKYLAIFYKASRQDQRFLCTAQQKEQFLGRGRSSLPNESEWPTLAEEKLQEIIREYEPRVTKKFRENAEGVEQSKKDVSTSSIPPEKVMDRHDGNEAPPTVAPSEITLKDMEGLLSVIAHISQKSLTHPEFARLAGKCGYQHEALHTDATTEVFVRMPDGVTHSVDKTDLPLPAITSMLLAVNRQLAHIVQGSHKTVTAETAKNSEALMRALLITTGTVEALRMKVPEEWTDMLEEFTGRAIFSTKHQPQKRGKRP